MSASLQLALAVIPVAAVVLMAVFLWVFARRQQTGLVAPPAPSVDPPDPLGMDALMTAISARLAAVEGRIGALAAGLEVVAVLTQRVAMMETNMPALQEAMEKYADQISRLDKRNTERVRRADADQSKNDNQSAGQAAADLVGAAGGGSDPSPTQPAAPNPRIGVVGSGGRGRHRRGT